GSAGSWRLRSGCPLHPSRPRACPGSPAYGASAEQAAQARLQSPSLAVEVLAFLAPGREALLDLAPERGGMVGLQQVAQLVASTYSKAEGRPSTRAIPSAMLPSATSKPHS